MSILFSVIHAAFGRPKKTAETMRMWRDRAVAPGSVQYIVCSDRDDPDHFNIMRETASVYGFGFNAFFAHPGTGSARAWNYAAAGAIAEIMIQGQDDVYPPEKWDQRLLDAIDGHEWGGGDKNRPWFMAVSDGYRKDWLCCTAIMSRSRYKQCGREFLHPGYISVFSDDEVTYRAIRDSREGKCELINARHLTFLHRHHYHDKSVPMDSTYERENSPEAYRVGSELFAKRNPEAATDGIRTWG